MTINTIDTAQGDSRSNSSLTLALLAQLLQKGEEPGDGASGPEGTGAQAKGCRGK